MMTTPTPDIHTCGPFCTRPACIKTERDKLLTDDDIQKIMEMLERHQTFNYTADCPVVAMRRKLQNMLAHGINPKDAQP